MILPLVIIMIFQSMIYIMCHKCASLLRSHQEIKKVIFSFLYFSVLQLPYDVEFLFGVWLEIQARIYFYAFAWHASVLFSYVLCVIV